MRLSHSKLNTILSCPMTYYLTYYQGISSIVEKPALTIGSAVHYGIEHKTEDLSDFFDTSFKTKDMYSYEQILSEAMVHGYLKHEETILNEILQDEDGKKLTLEESYNELYLTGKLKSFLEKVEYHEFVGIIDLLLLTNKGFVIIDYKTSSQIPDWSSYIEQIYRYIFLLKSEFPEIPVYKIGIINIRKAKLRQKKTETVHQFWNRLKFEYEVNDENYVNYHMYLPSEFDEKLINKYINNLSKMADTAHLIDERQSWYINYGNATSIYGKSQYWDIFYGTDDAHMLYKIQDKIFDDTENMLLPYNRPCVDIDMKVIDNKNVLNKYDIFSKEFELNSNLSKEKFTKYLKDKYITNDELLQSYFNTLNFLNEKYTH